jgi:hypothetical protein
LSDVEDGGETVFPDVDPPLDYSDRVLSRTEVNPSLDLIIVF